MYSKKIAGFLVLIMAVVCVGCGKKEPVNFGSMSQAGMVSYLEGELKDEYGGTFVVGTVSKQDESTAGEYGSYHAMAGRSKDSCQYDVWVSESGEILDTLFLLEREEEISDWVKGKIDGLELPEDGYYLATHLEFKSCPNDSKLRKWSLDELLNSDLTKLNIYIAAKEGLTEDMVKSISGRIDVNGGVTVKGRNAGPRLISAVFEISVGAELNEEVIQRVVTESTDFEVNK